ncbi:MAG: methionine--tRNA ligase [Bacillota bacterium]|nr:methionine--tRNA ligase [Bacillota bacterium]
MERTYYLTVAIDYTNGEPHLGHAYEKVAADVVARAQRLLGRQVFYTMGADEHSHNVMKAAQERGLAVQEYCNRMAALWKETWDELGLSYTHFMQTSDPRHERAVQTLVQRIYDRGYVYRGTYRGLYCRSCEAFYSERDLVDGLCPWHLRPVEVVEEENYFFKLSAFQKPLEELLARSPAFVEPEIRLHEVEKMLEGGLEDISLSRPQTGWGVPVPWDPSHTVYVWFDALITYLSATGYGWEEGWETLWPADVHFIGKDILRFHCIIWPAMLMAADLPLPRKVFAHGFWYANGQRFSKSLGNVVDPKVLARRYGLDAMRHYLVTEIEFGADGNFTDESILKRTNSDLANDLGNLLNRTTTMLERFFQGRVPHATVHEDHPLRRLAETVREEYRGHMESFRLRQAVEAVFALVKRANKYIDETQPWAKKEDPAEQAIILYALAESLRIAAILLSPVLLQGAPGIFAQLGLDPALLQKARLEDARWGGLLPGTAIRKGAPLYPRLDPTQVEPVVPPR